ncbi:uncharacterized protein LOC123558138 [Mercenaria mercenaria]|uniref:uncharacterized protein LOC123558138 n=1 Tax=Mercenaria mercenaria TaxID=6596 RepID=UPI001E1D2ED2|nr:uncharacterized protein LOC123558138 [Mercenaria mercenaria]
MVVKCSIFGCTNRKDHETDLEYYRLPAVVTNQGEECEKLSSERRRLWLANIGQNFENKNIQNVRVCSAHFVNGKKSYLHDKLSPDWAPTVNLGRKRHASETACDRYDRMLERKRRKS